MAPGWFLFETTESVIEVLWDIALAVFILRLALIYAFFAFTLSALLTYLSYASFSRSSFGSALDAYLPQALATRSELAVLVLHLLLVVLCARSLVTYYEIPRVVGFRLAIGVVGALTVAGADLLAAGILYEAGEAGLMAHWRVDASAVLLALALLPSLLMLCEGHPSEFHDATHGHGRKEVSEAM